MLLVTPTDAANFLRLSKSTLAKMRISGRGPTYRKHGRNVVYDQSELERWSSQFIQPSTSHYLDDPSGHRYQLAARRLARDKGSEEKRRIQNDEEEKHWTALIKRHNEEFEAVAAERAIKAEAEERRIYQEAERRLASLLSIKKP